MNFKQKRLNSSSFIVVGTAMLLCVKLFFIQVINSNYYKQLVSLKKKNHPLAYVHTIPTKNLVISYKNAQLISLTELDIYFKGPMFQLVSKNPFMLVNITALKGLAELSHVAKPKNPPRAKNAPIQFSF